MLSVNCPSCGGLVEFHSSVSLIAVCSHCRSGLIRKDLNLETFGKIAELKKETSSLQLGAQGEYRQISFLIVGRVQMKYDGGTWSEWCLAFQDGRTGWLGESSGHTSVSFQIKPKEKIPEENRLEVGQEIVIAGKAYVLSNIEEASYFSAEGELPSELPLGETSIFADLSNSKGGFATIDFSESPPLVYVGEYVPFDVLKLQGLKPKADS